MEQISLSDLSKIGVNLFVGFLTVLLQNVIPIGGGGISLIFVLTVPFTVGLSIISSFVYYLLASKGRVRAKNILFFLVIAFNLFITFTMYPYAN